MHLELVVSVDTDNIPQSGPYLYFLMFTFLCFGTYKAATLQGYLCCCYFTKEINFVMFFHDLYIGFYQEGRFG